MRKGFHKTRRFAEFTASILTLHGGMESLGIAGGGEDMLLNDVAKLRVGVLGLLKRLAEELPTKKQQVVFLVNNYDQVLRTFGERGILGDEAARFEELLAAHRGAQTPRRPHRTAPCRTAPAARPRCPPPLPAPRAVLHIPTLPASACTHKVPALKHARPPPLSPPFQPACLSQPFSRPIVPPALFVEEELAGGFGALISLVQRAEGNESADMSGVEAVVRSFASTWKSAIETIHENVRQYFNDFVNGMEILKQVLTQLLLYCTRFQELVKKHWGRQPPPFARDIVPTAQSSWK